MKSINKIISAFLLSLSLCLSAYSQENQLELIDKTAPKIEFLNKDVKPDFYKGKILVLDFWATWCSPCIASFPHMNKLADEFSSKNVVFAAISDEPESRVMTFFTRTKKILKALSLLDSQNTTFDNYKITSIPRCIIIDENNVVKWIGSGSELTADVINNVIEKKKIPLLDIKNNVNNIVLKPKQPLLKFEIFKADSSSTISGGAMMRNSDFIDFSRTGISLGDLLQDLTSLSKFSRFKTNQPTLLNNKYDLDFNSRVIKDDVSFSEFSDRIVNGKPRINFILNQIQTSLNLNLKVIENDAEIFELVIKDEEKLKTFLSLQHRHSSTTEHDNYPKMEIVGYNLKDISLQMEPELQQIIECNINDINKYDISLDFATYEILTKTLAFHGLALEKKKAKVKFLDINFK